MTGGYTNIIAFILHHFAEKSSETAITFYTALKYGAIDPYSASCDAPCVVHLPVMVYQHGEGLARR